jgi:hypothetical protein
MELKKGQNMIEHEEEIYSRPARTWFQSGQAKLKAEGMLLLDSTHLFITDTTIFSCQQTNVRGRLQYCCGSEA